MWAFRPYALFQSKKHNKKRNKNNVIKYKRVQKSMPKSSFFVDFLFQILWKTIFFQHCFERVLTYERLFSWLSVNLTFRSKKHSKKRVKNTYLNTMDSKSNAKEVQNMYFLFQNHCKTLIFQQYFERVLEYELLFSWLNGSLPFRSKKHSKKRVKARIWIQLLEKIIQKKLELMFFIPKSF